MFAGWHGSVARNDGWADVWFHWMSFSEQTLTNTAKRRRTETERQNKENEIRRNTRLVSRCQMFAPKGRWRDVRMEKSTKELQENWSWTASFWHSWIPASEERHWWSRKTCSPGENNCCSDFSLFQMRAQQKSRCLSLTSASCPALGSYLSISVSVQRKLSKLTPRHGWICLLPVRPGRTVILTSTKGLRDLQRVFSSRVP